MPYPKKVKRKFLLVQCSMRRELMSKYYITFGQIHVHSVNGKTFDKDCIAEIEAENMNEAHAYAMNVFDARFHQCVTAKQCNDEFMSYFPRGIIPV